jgi:hypothetical protein
LEVNGYITTSKYFNTIVVRRFDETTDDQINLRELQTWVNGVNIMVDNGLTSYFALWSDKETDTGFYLTYDSTFVYNNIITSDFEAHSLPNQANTLIIKNIPLTYINDIQALIIYNRRGFASIRALGLIIELYNSIKDPDLNEVLATTNEITTSSETYRFDFPSISTYTGSFATTASTTLIMSNSDALTEEANVISFPTEITGDVVVEGDLTANNLTVGFTNVITEINTKQDMITTATDLDCKSLTTNNLEVNGGVNIDTHTYFDTIVIRRPTGFSGDANFF